MGIPQSARSSQVLVGLSWSQRKLLSGHDGVRGEAVGVAALRMQADGEVRLTRQASQSQCAGRALRNGRVQGQKKFEARHKEPLTLDEEGREVETRWIALLRGSQSA